MKTKPPMRESLRDKAGSIAKVGRPRGKHSDERYKQVGVWLPIDLIKEVKRQLILTDGELSGLVESHLENWLKKETAKSAK
jgi:hypothetical protein